MLTFDFDRLGVRPGDDAIDIGSGNGRHAFELYRRGANVTAFDHSPEDMAEVETMFAALRDEGEAPEDASARVEVGDALDLPFADESFDVAVLSEILEHIPDDERAIAEAARILKPGGVAAVSVPRWLPEKLCWALSDEYHEVEGGHVRVYKADELAGKLASAGMRVTRTDHVHALHVPYWWLKCAVGVDNPEHPLVRGYHKLLVWDMLSAPAATRVLDRALNPVIGKSVALYLVKDEVTVGAP